MPEVQDTQIHLPCQHFRCDSFRFDKQKRRLGEGADAMADASQHGAEDYRHTRGHNPEHPQADYGRGPCQEMAPDQRPTCLAVDGFAVHKGHRYAACVMDLGNGDALWVGKGRPEADFAKFFEESGLERLRGVKAVAMDRNASCNKLVKRHMPRADIVYDRCHMHPVRQGCPRRGEAAGGPQAQGSGAARIQERKHLVLQAKAETCAHTDIKSARWTLLRKDASLTGNARDALEAILEKHRDVAICHSMKEELSELFRIRGGGDKGYALQEWKRWFDSAGAGGIPALANHARHGISTGKFEGLDNRIQVAKRIGYGYRDDDSFFTTIRFISIPDLGSLSPKET